MPVSTTAPSAHTRHNGSLLAPFEKSVLV